MGADVATGAAVAVLATGDPVGRGVNSGGTTWAASTLCDIGTEPIITSPATVRTTHMSGATIRNVRRTVLYPSYTTTNAFGSGAIA